MVVPVRPKCQRSDWSRTVGSVGGLRSGNVAWVVHPSWCLGSVVEETRVLARESRVERPGDGGVGDGQADCDGYVELHFWCARVGWAVEMWLKD